MDLTDTQIAGVYGLLGALIGGSITLIGSSMANRHAAKMDKKRLEHQDRMDLIEKAARFIIACRAFLAEYNAAYKPEIEAMPVGSARIRRNDSPEVNKEQERLETAYWELVIVLPKESKSLFDAAKSLYDRTKAFDVTDSGFTARLIAFERWESTHSRYDNTEQDFASKARLK